MLRIGVDTGGTFTDLVLYDGRRLLVHKVPSTPTAPDRAVVAGVAALTRASPDLAVVHGTTVGLNALLRGKAARTAFVTSAGFRDLLELGRQDRPEIYALEVKRRPPLVPREARFTVEARGYADAPALRPAPGAVRRLATLVRRARVESLAIGLLHSYREPGIERELARDLAALGLPVTCSAELLPEHREYERFSTAVVNAALVPVMSRYLDDLEQALAPARLLLMQSDGGLLAAGHARKEPARVLFSGPAGGAAGAALVARLAHAPGVLAFDVGGTSTDVSFLAGRPAVTREARVDGLPVALPTVDVHSVGCGGGSIAWLDAGGALRVGPDSAGAEPGPACYGRGGEATLTDAHVALGRIAPGCFLGGRFTIDPDLAVRAIERLAHKLGVSARRAAEGILEVADTAVERALKTMSLERGVDPRGLCLLPFGGAGGLHAVRLARRLAIPRVLVPPLPGALSALGLALAQPSVERSMPVFARLDQWRRADRARAEGKLAAETRAAFARDGFAPTRAARSVELDLRYEGQSFELRCAGSGDVARRFHALHQRVFGFARRDQPIEVVQLRVQLRAPDPSPARARALLRAVSSTAATRSRDTASVVRAPLLRGGARLRRIDRRDLAPGQRVVGPALIEEFSASFLLEAGSSARVGPFGELDVRPA